MKASDVKIGNQIIRFGIDYDIEGRRQRDREGDQIIQVYNISETAINGVHLDECEGIEITEALLESNGFVKNGPYYWKFFESGSICLHLDSCWWYEIDVEIEHGDSGSHARKIEFFHELQNLVDDLEK